MPHAMVIYLQLQRISFPRIILYIIGVPLL
jgi:hypothetical protein